MTTMRGIVYERYGRPEVLSITELPKPVPAIIERIVQFEDIVEAHKYVEANKKKGSLIVRIQQK